ncbi:MAG: glycosyltransferase [Firmicutes bacterium]|nr:glycosyltransferase [Bacillota bacterium]
MPKLERVLILSASYGEGHQQAALAVQDALVARNPGVDVKIIDYLHTVHPMLNSVARYCYLKSVRFAPALYGLFYKGTSRITSRSLLQKRLNHLGFEDLAEYLNEYRPTVVLSTFPTPAGVMSLLKQRGLTDIPGATVITDHAIHSQWIHPCTDHYFVGSDHVRQGLISRGVSDHRISVTGIPIRSEYFNPVDRDQIRRRLGLEADVPTLLVMGGAYGVLGDITQICEELFASVRRIQVIVVCGRNVRMRTQIEQLSQDAQNPVWVFGFSREIHELMAVSDLVITKAGGLTISEALAMELPMLLYRPIPGQETQNAAFLVKSRVAVLARNRKDVIQHVERLFRDGGSRLARMRANTRLIRRLEAADDIAVELANVEGEVSVREQLAVSEHLYAEQS